MLITPKQPLTPTNTTASSTASSSSPSAQFPAASLSSYFERIPSSTGSTQSPEQLPSSQSSASPSVSGAIDSLLAQTIVTASSAAALKTADTPAQGTPFDQKSANASSALGQFLSGHPGSEAVNVGDGRVAVFNDKGGASFGVFGSDGSKLAPAGTDLQRINTNVNGGLGTMVLGPGAYLNFDSKGITVDPTMKVMGTPLGYDAHGNIGIAAGSASELTEQANPFFAGDGIQTSSSTSVNLYPSGTPKTSDINQSAMGDCYFDAALGSMASTAAGQTAIRNAISQTGTNPPAYSVKMYDPSGAPISIAVSGGGDVGGTVGANKQINWASLMEEAYTKYNDQYHTSSKESGVAGMDQGGQGQQVFDAFLGQHGGERSTLSTTQSPEALGKQISKQLSQGQFLTAGTKDSTDHATYVGTTSNGTQVVSGHAYSVLGVDTKNQTITLRNPWGDGGTSGAPMANDGIVTMSLRDFQRLFFQTMNSGNAHGAASATSPTSSDATTSSASS